MSPELEDKMAFKTRMVWRSVGAGHWDVELVELIDGRAALLATLLLSLDEWIDLACRRNTSLELQQEGEQRLQPAGGAIG